MVSPLHRDPTVDDADDPDYGCFTKRNNRRVAICVERAIKHIESGTLTTYPAIVDFVRERLERIPSACDTVVKENVFMALDDVVAAAGITNDDPMIIYGW